ncbi:MAG: hypothetical protein BAJALOKI3v1_630005 [Promethearchaeota archaeon]|nr:MAG: hypothetical protein BAJALOKI3v1_630005 [Candidatus Lokiarchaeota archaeon]
MEIEGAKQLFEIGQFEGVLNSLEKIRNIEDLSDLEALEYNLLKSSVYLRLRLDEKCLRFAKLAYHQAQKSKNTFLSIDALLNIAWSFFWLGKLEKAFELIFEVEEKIENMETIQELKFERRKGFLFFIKAVGSWFQAEPEGFKYAKKSVSIRRKLGIKHEIVESLSILGGLSTYFKEDLDASLAILDECHNLALEINHPWAKTFNQKNYGDIYHFKGDLKKALNYYKKGVKDFIEKDNPLPAVSTMGLVGKVYREMGDIDQCCNYLLRSYDISKITNNDWLKSRIITDLIEILVLRGNIQKAEKYLEKLEDINNREGDNTRIKNSYLISKALILKSYKRFQSHAKAQKIFHSIIRDKTSENEILITALLNQCELLLDELNLTKKADIIDEIDLLVEELLKWADSFKSYWILSETLVLQARLALLKFKLTNARRLLTKAQKMAEKYQMYWLAAKISHEHDSLLQKLGLWKDLEVSESSIAERINYSNLSEQLSYMIQKTRIKLPEIKNENPIMILIISEGGNPIFTHLFVNKTALESHILGSFLATFDYFTKELFSEGLDRAIFGDYTLIMNFISPFYIAYLFKGESYFAVQRMRKFTKELDKNNNIWKSLLKHHQKNKTVKLGDIAHLDSILKNIFSSNSAYINNLK